MSELAPSSVQAFIEALNGGKGDLDAWLECNNEAEVRAHIRACLAAPPAAPAPGDMVMVPLKFVQDFNTLAHNYCLRAVPPDYYSGTEADAFQHAYSRCGSDLRRLREILAAAPAPAVPLTDTRKLCTCDGAGRGPGRACVVQAGGRLGELWKCAKSAAPAVREPLIDEMDAVASKYAHKLALDLECVLSDYNGKWWDTAMQTIGEYRMAMNRIHEQESPTHMGEPVLPKHGIGGGGK